MCNKNVYCILYTYVFPEFLFIDLRSGSSKDNRDSKQYTSLLTLILCFIQEQFEDTQHQPAQSGDANSIADPLISQTMSFKSNTMCDNFLMAPEETRSVAYLL